MKKSTLKLLIAGGTAAAAAASIAIVKIYKSIKNRRCLDEIEDDEYYSVEEIENIDEAELSAEKHEKLVITKRLFNYDDVTTIDSVEALLDELQTSGGITTRSNGNSTTWFDKKARPIKLETNDGEVYYYEYRDSESRLAHKRTDGVIIQYDKNNKKIYVHNTTDNVEMWYYLNGNLGRFKSTNSDIYFDENQNILSCESLVEASDSESDKVITE